MTDHLPVFTDPDPDPGPPPASEAAVIIRAAEALAHRARCGHGKILSPAETLLLSDWLAAAAREALEIGADGWAVLFAAAITSREVRAGGEGKHPTPAPPTPQTT